MINPPRSYRADFSSASRGGGFTLVTLVVFVTVLSIAAAVAMSLWSRVVQREKEEELIFRGLQYAEAIRVFQQRFGRYPVTLEELIEVNPRSIRRLWKDPMSETGEWSLILAQAAGGPVGQPGQAPATGRPGTAQGGRREDGRSRLGAQAERSRRRSGGRRRGQRQEVQTGPIIGVRSKVEESGIKTFLGGQKYSEWRFTPEVLPTLPGPLTGDNVPRLNARWAGRPLPQGLEPQQGQGPEELDETPKRRSQRRRRPGRDRRSGSSDRGGGRDDG